ncbi:hypothetical protein D3C77_361620 [compost metagenome]
MKLERRRGNHFPLLACCTDVIIELFPLKLDVHDLSIQPAGAGWFKLELIGPHRVQSLRFEAVRDSVPWPKR